ncbi:DUF2591 domain-containing protein [Leclercia adecarboxylata]|uniref:phage protein NinX family protein n=1 Tax=Leclercia adecarboxylata TaxID=83655 RepID=UPI003B27AA8D
MDYSKLSDFEINRRVFEAKSGLPTLGYPHNSDKRSCGHKDINGNYQWFDFCNNAADAWQIIAKHQISVCAYHRANPGMKRESWWEADIFAEFITRDDNPLRAAMIVFLKMQESSNVPANSTGSDLR